MQKTALIIAVGTGGDTENGILFSIKKNRPDKIVFIHSSASEDKLGIILRKISNDPDIDITYEKLLKSEIEDFQKVYSKTIAIIDKLILDGLFIENIIVDFTFGTKAITAGMITASIFKNIENCSYIGGDRDLQGKVITGTEEIISIEPNKVYNDYEYLKFCQFFNLYQFNAAREISNNLGSDFWFKERTKLNECYLKKITENAYVASRSTVLSNNIKDQYLNLLNAYDLWDKFNYNKAEELLNRTNNSMSRFEFLDMPAFKTNFDFLKTLVKEKKSKKYGKLVAVDLFSNALRREFEGKFDDALIRTYRIMELISQYLLNENFSIDPGNVDRDKLEKLLGSKNAFRLEDILKKNFKGEFTTSGLSINFDILSMLGNNIGNKFMSDRDIRGHLGIRNQSILIHNLDPISHENYKVLKNCIYLYLVEFIGDKKELEGLLQSAMMAKFLI